MLSYRRIIALLCVIAVLLAACDGESEPDPAATQPPPTVPPVITQIVTPLPTFTPAPTPTLAYDLVPVAGRWILRFDVAILGASLANEFTYSGTLDLEVQLDTTVSGFGSFTQHISSPPCQARVLDSQALSFTAQGTTYPVGDQVAVDLTILPDDPNQVEHYALICPDYQDIRQISQPILWPALSAVPEQTFKGGSIAGLHWRFVLQSGQTATIDANLMELTGGTLEGLFSGELRLQRG